MRCHNLLVGDGQVLLTTRILVQHVCICQKMVDRPFKLYHHVTDIAPSRFRRILRCPTHLPTTTSRHGWIWMFPVIPLYHQPAYSFPLHSPPLRSPSCQALAACN